MRIENRGGASSKPVKWNGMTFKSLTALAKHEGITKGGMAYNIKWKSKFRGHEIYYL